MKKRLLALLLLAGLSVTSCVENPYSLSSIQARIAAERNHYNSLVNQELSIKEVAPLPRGWKNLVKQKIAMLLKDPDSAKYTFTDVPEVYGFSNQGKYPVEYSNYISPLVGYVGSVFVNAKNSYGGYTGNQLWLYIIADGEIAYLVTNDIVYWQSTYQAISHINQYEVFIKK